MRKIKTTYKTPRRAAKDLIEKINNDPFVKELGDTAFFMEHQGQAAIVLEGFGFDAAMGFLDGTGLYGYEGFGSCGPVFDQRNSNVFLEPYNGCIIYVFPN